MIELIEPKKESARPHRKKKIQTMLKKTTTQKDGRVINPVAAG